MSKFARKYIHNDGSCLWYDAGTGLVVAETSPDSYRGIWRAEVTGGPEPRQGEYISQGAAEAAVETHLTQIYS